jgi:hypothetical protein
MGGDLLAHFGLAAGAAAASGMRLYATVAALGLLHRFGALRLPAGLEGLAEPWVIGLAAALYVVEFVADKVPAVDTAWDAIHTFIRIPAAAALGFAALGDLQEPYRIAAGLLCGTIALSTHGLKAGTRLAANTSPEPFSNWALSFGEDVGVFALLWLAIAHPLLTLIVVVALLIASLLVARWMLRALRRLFAPRRRAEAGGG